MDNAPRITRSGSEKRQRQKVVRMRCDDAELQQLEEGAERVGLTVGAFMRRRCLGSAGERAVRRPPVERAVLAQLLGQLGKCGSNVKQIGDRLNEIARSLNTGEPPPADIPEAIADIREVCAEIMRLLGRTPE
jgi:hypothetical protein